MVKLNILIFAPQYYPTNSGYSNAITNFVEALSKNKEIKKIIVVTPTILRNHEEINNNKIKVVRIPFKKFPLKTFIFSIEAYHKIKKIINKENIDIIFYETGEYPLLAYLLLRYLKNTEIPLILRLHAATDTEVFAYPYTLYHKLLCIITKKTYKNLEFIASTNNYHIDFYKRVFLKNNPWNVGKKFYFILPNVINLLEIPENNLKMLKNEVFDKYDIPKNKKIILTLGRLNTSGFLQKGIQDLVLSVYLIYKRNPEILKDTLFLIVGSGEKKKYLESLTKNLNINKYFIFIEKMDNLEVQILQKCAWATVLLSRFEGMSMFALEALANGSPLIFSKVGGLIDLIDEGKNGYFVEPQNIEDIAKKLEKILSLEEEEINKMRIYSKHLFNKKFNKKNIINKFVNICKICMSLKKLNKDDLKCKN